jgi:hypothetical protein
MVSMTASAKQTLLNAHNTNRNKIAGGNQPGFNQAAQMMTVVSFYFYIESDLIKKIKF